MTDKDLKLKDCVDPVNPVDLIASCSCPDAPNFPSFHSILKWDFQLLKFISLIDPDLPQPEELSYSTSLSSGIDLRAYLPNRNIVLYPGDTVVVPTGYKCKIHPDYEGQIRPRSGLAAKYNITVLNSPGTIDADYDKEIMIILHRMLDNEPPATPFTISNGDKIAQFVLSKVEREHFYLPKTFVERIGGFGSTGVK